MLTISPARNPADGSADASLKRTGKPEPLTTRHPRLVDRDDPRYFDLKFFPATADGENFVKARYDQVAAIEARAAKMRLHRETITISDNSPGSRGSSSSSSHTHSLSASSSRTADEIIAAAGGLRQAFPSFIPAKPYCADFLEDGLRIRAKTVALSKRHLQLNGPASFQWMTHDIDRQNAAAAHSEANLPPPNVIAINVENGHAHSGILLATPVARHAASRLKPLQFYAAVERALARRLQSDRHYTGLIAKNPRHAHWHVEWRREEPYTLPELAASLTAEDMAPEVSPCFTMGAGRNCTVFDELRQVAYCEVREFKRAGQTFDAFTLRLERVALGINLQFPRGLMLSEIRAIVRSVAKWTWRRFSAERFAERQALLGRRGMANRWAGHAAANKTKPWEAMGVSRATYYRRKASAQTSMGSPPEVRPMSEESFQFRNAA